MKSRARGVDAIGGKRKRTTGTVKTCYAPIAIGVDGTSDSDAHVIHVRAIGRIKDSASCIFAEVNTGISGHEHAITPVGVDSIRRYVSVRDTGDENPIFCVPADGIADNTNTRRTRNNDPILLVVLNYVR